MAPIQILPGEHIIKYMYVYGMLYYAYGSTRENDVSPFSNNSAVLNCLLRKTDRKLQ